MTSLAAAERWSRRRIAIVVLLLLGVGPLVYAIIELARPVDPTRSDGTQPADPDVRAAASAKWTRIMGTGITGIVLWILALALLLAPLLRRG